MWLRARKSQLNKRPMRRHRFMLDWDTSRARPIELKWILRRVSTSGREFRQE
jgi:hypothetical protein